MDDKKREELKAAYHTLCEYMLWRKGRTDKLSFDEKEIGVAFEIATGAILDYISCDAELHTTQISLNSCEQALGELRQKQKELERMAENCESPDPDAPEEVMDLDQSVFDSFGPKFKYAAVDSNGECWVYTDVPMLSDTIWISSHEVGDGDCGRVVDGRFNTECWDHVILARGIGELAVYGQWVFDKADPKFKYAAADRDFKCFLYADKPVPCEEDGCWTTTKLKDAFSFSYVGECAVVDWKQSLICRQQTTSDASERGCSSAVPKKPLDQSVFKLIDRKYKLDQNIFKFIDRKYKYAAVHSDGFAYAFTTKPRASKGFWYRRGDGETLFLGAQYDASNWKESLIKRED